MFRLTCENCGLVETIDPDEGDMLNESDDPEAELKKEFICAGCGWEFCTVQKT